MRRVAMATPADIVQKRDLIVNRLRVWIPGAPVGKARARVVRWRGGLAEHHRVSAYTPKRTKWWARGAALCMLAARTRDWKLDGLYHVDLLAVFSSGSPRRSDLDNVLKNSLDAGNKILWDDDRLVVSFRASMVVSRKEEPGVELLVMPVAREKVYVD